MFSYYGSKKSIIDFYPPPKYEKVIEPFVGAGSYVLKYWKHDVTIVDKYEIVVKIWKWLQECEISDIEKLPHKMDENDNLNNYNFECEEAKLLMGFIIAKGSQVPRNKPTARATVSRPNTINFTLNKIKGTLHKIKHWTILHGDYRTIENQKATWFIDPPYQFGGHAYVESEIDFVSLANWCRCREGQVIVCENTKANWLPFKPMIKNKGTHHETIEALWSNHKTSYDNQQTGLAL